MRQSQLMAKAYGKEEPKEGPDIQIKDIPQLKKDLNYLKNKEGFENKIYDDSKSENKYLKKGDTIENDGRIVYADGTLGGYATIGHGHKVTANDKYQIGKVYSQSELDDELIRDYFKKKKQVINSIKESNKNPDDIPEEVMSILIRNSFWGVSKSSFPMYFDSMINGLYKDAADNLKFTDPAKGEEGGYTKIFEPEEGMSGLKKRTEEVMQEILSLYD